MTGMKHAPRDKIKSAIICDLLADHSLQTPLTTGVNKLIVQGIGLAGLQWSRCISTLRL